LDLDFSQDILLEKKETRFVEGENRNLDKVLLSPFQKLGSPNLGSPNFEGLTELLSRKLPDFSETFSVPSAPKTPKMEDVEKMIVHQEKKEENVPDFEIKHVVPERKCPRGQKSKDYFYKGRKYIGPTQKKRPNYKSKQTWEWDLYPHGISKQNGKLRVQIKQKGVNPTYPSFPNTLQGLLDAAMFRDEETQRLWDAGILVRAPKFNFDHGSALKRQERPNSPTLVKQPKSPSAVPRKKRKSIKYDDFEVDIDEFPMLIAQGAPMTPVEDVPQQMWNLDEFMM